MQRLRILTLSSALAVATLVCACGGGGGTNEDAGPVAEDAGPVAEDAGTGPSNPLLGSVYVQPQGLGFASYHFDAEDDVPYGEAMKALDAARGGGAVNIAVLTDSVIK